MQSEKTETQFSRSELILGPGSTRILAARTVAVFGIGGVGSYAVEALARSGIGHLILIDADVVTISNLNRQLIALHSTIGKPKVEVARKRLLDINPEASVSVYKTFLDRDNISLFDFTEYDYVVDCIDTVTSKILLAEECLHAETPIISSMGTGNKQNPGQFEIADISRTSVCPLARVVRQELRKRGIEHLKVLYSRENPQHSSTDIAGTELLESECTAAEGTKKPRKRVSPGSLPFVPSVAGLLIAGEVVRDLLTTQDHTD